jgi:hypothetical protein
MHILKMVVKFCTKLSYINIARMDKTKDLSKDCKNIVLNLFKFFQLEKARGRPFYSPDNLIKRTCKAGCQNMPVHVSLSLSR